jgi:transcriptional regulator with XRE-family HTH domain
VDKIIGSRLKAARLGAKLTQSDLGKIVASSFQQIQKYERGMNRISSAALVQFAQALDLPVMYFFENLPGLTASPQRKANAPGAFERFAKSRQAENLLRSFYALRTQEERDTIVKLLDILK